MIRRIAATGFVLAGLHHLEGNPMILDSPPSASPMWILVFSPSNHRRTLTKSPGTRKSGAASWELDSDTFSTHPRLQFGGPHGSARS